MLIVAEYEQDFFSAFEDIVSKIVASNNFLVDANLDDFITRIATKASLLEGDRSLVQNIHLMNETFVRYEIPKWKDEPITLPRGWWIIVNRQAVAIALLCSEGMWTEATPLVRSAFEYSMAICYANHADVGELNDEVSKRTFDDFARVVTSTAGPNSPFEEMIAELAKDFEAPKTQQWTSKFKKQLKKLRVSSEAYPFYSALSTFAHPTLAGVLSFGDFKENLRAQSEPNGWSRVMTGNPILWALQCQAWAALAIDQSVDGGLSWRNVILESLAGIELPLAEVLFKDWPPKT